MSIPNVHIFVGGERLWCILVLTNPHHPKTTGVVSGEEPTTSELATGSPKNRVKFLCSHGGKILPRPADGHLKYVGGETRVIFITRDINFPELMKKLTYLIEGDMILKYQLIPEDLDALVSVKSDEDLRHMLEEYDRHESKGTTPRLRAFLFPANPVVFENQSGPAEPHALEQRYIDAINGILRTTTPRLGLKHKLPSINTQLHAYSITSACSSPRSPDSCTTDATNHETTFLQSYHNGMIHMQRIHSSPSLCSLNAQCQSNHQIQHHQRPPPNHHYHHQLSYQSNKMTLDPHHPHRGGVPERLIKVRSIGQAESSRYCVDHATPRYNQSATRHSGGSVCCKQCRHCNDYGPCMDRRVNIAESIPVSPSLPQSPRRSSFGVKAWDSIM